MAEFNPQEKTQIIRSDADVEGDAAELPSEPQVKLNLPVAVGRYQIVHSLGKGGFATVYLATDDQLNRQVAIKLPHYELLESEAESYLNEARMVASLDHEHIVPVYDVGNTDEYPVYIVSKYIEGSNLRTKIRERRFRYDESCRLVATIADALHYAHTHGLVHRDVKPGNILIGADDKPFLVDFGLALHEDRVGEGPTCAGTPAYMSPEQARGEGHRVDGRSDIFSLGVVLYELLAGKKPFRGANHSEILTQVEFSEPKPLRQIDDRIPRELARICYRAIEKRASERYFTARDLVDDLEHFLKDSSTGTGSSISATTLAVTTSLPLEESSASGGTTPGSTVQDSAVTFASEKQLRIVPKGLRSFDSHDAEFFLSLLPGPRDRHGLPDSLRFWKAKIEEADSEKTFAVGLIYGPSGCGKSSLVKAGLLPCLGVQVDSVYVESTQDETESRLLNGLRRHYPSIPVDMGIREALTAVRRGSYVPPYQKVLIVLDQFEQWLHSSRDLAESELVQALRQCDGGRVQCILMVRDDFWMSVSRFMRALEIRLQEGENSAAVDLFDKSHAEKVMRAFGFAFGCLPERRSEISSEQQLFLKTAVDGLAQEGRVICVRLAVFVEMMKGRPWTPSTLRDVGGAKGLGVNFLEETFNGVSAPPERRYHQVAARAVLQSLLPNAGSDLKGGMRSESELMEVCGYSDREDEFQELIRILDGSLRLISVIDAADGAQSRTVEAEAAAATNYYQLSHDYLVGSLRDWLTRKQQESRRGRAQLLLSRRSELWIARPEVKQLPSLVEWLRITILTRGQHHSEAEQQMMQSANRRHGRNLLLGSVMLLLLAVSVFIGRNLFHQQQQQALASARVNTLVTADLGEVPAILVELDGLRHFATPYLEQQLQTQGRTSRGRLLASLALLQHDPSQQSFLLDRAQDASPKELRLIRETFAAQGIDPSTRLWGVVDSAGVSADAKFRALSLLAGLDVRHQRWAFHAPFVAARLVDETSISFALQWAEAFHPVRQSLIGPLALSFRDPESSDLQRTVAANILADYGEQDSALLTSLILDTQPGQFSVLKSALEKNRAGAIKMLRQKLAENPLPPWPDRDSDGWESANSDIDQAIDFASGMLTERFAVCQKMSWDRFRAVVEELRPCGYRPVCFRPFVSDGEMFVAAVWTRDGLSWQINFGTSAENLRSEDQQLRDQKMRPVDVAHFRSSATDGSPAADQFAAVWATQWDGINDARMYVGVTEEQHPAAWSPLVNDSFSVRTNLKVKDINGTDVYSSVRWRLWHEPRSSDCWNDHLSDYLHKISRGWVQRDVRMNLNPDDGSPEFSAVWWDGTPHETVQLHGLTMPQHLERCHELAATGYRPWSISVVSPETGIVAASVWARPIDEAHLDRVAVRKANAVLALLHLGAPDELWPLLRHQPDPRLRSVLIDELALYECPIEVLLNHLKLESDHSIRRAILLSLAEYKLDSVDAGMRDVLVAELLSTFESDPDPGVHSACDLLLRKWGQQAPRDVIQEKLCGQKQPDKLWFVNNVGQTLAVIAGPVEFQMGSVPHTMGRNNFREAWHLRRIERSFAIAVQEVTIEQFQRFQPDADYADNLSRSSDCPINNRTWFDAARYCRWLSEQENIPEEQMCFPKLDEIKPGMLLPDNYLSRTGYRLPTAAEWEYACRAGAATERYFGHTELLLDKHAWTIQNSRTDGQFRLSPVGRLRPNDFGLFDMLGNVMEWCQDTSTDYPTVGPTVSTSDVENGLEVSEQVWRPVRGGAFLYQPSNARAGHRDNARPPRFNASAPYVGFRIARTMSVD